MMMGTVSYYYHELLTINLLSKHVPNRKQGTMNHNGDTSMPEKWLVLQFSLIQVATFSAIATWIFLIRTIRYYGISTIRFWLIIRPHQTRVCKHPLACKTGVAPWLTPTRLDPRLTRGVLIELLRCRKEEEQQRKKKAQNLSAASEFYK